MAVKLPRSIGPSVRIGLGTFAQLCDAAVADVVADGRGDTDAGFEAACRPIRDMRDDVMFTKRKDGTVLVNVRTDNDGSDLLDLVPHSGLVGILRERVKGMSDRDFADWTAGHGCAGADRNAVATDIGACLSGDILAELGRLDRAGRRPAGLESR